METSVNTVEGVASPDELGVTLSVRALLGILPGADLAPENDCSQMTLFNSIHAYLRELYDFGVRTVVDRGGMTLGRDLYLYETLAKHSGVRIIGSTGMAEQSYVGSHFTHPTSMHLKPASPLQDEELARLYSAEVLQGMVIPRVTRSAKAGLISVGVSYSGLTDFEGKSLRAAAQSALRTGASVNVRTGPDPLAELAVITSEGLDASRVVLSNMDRYDVLPAIWEAVERGAIVSFDNIGGTRADGYLDGHERIEIILELDSVSQSDQIILGSDGYGHGVAMPTRPNPASLIFREFIPQLREHGASTKLVDQLLVINMQTILTLQSDNESSLEAK